MNQEQVKPDIDETSIPDLSLSERTIAFLAKILLDGGADDHAFENGKCDRISQKLRSGKDGFFDATKFPSETSI